MNKDLPPFASADAAHQTLQTSPTDSEDLKIMLAFEATLKEALQGQLVSPSERTLQRIAAMIKEESMQKA